MSTRAFVTSAGLLLALVLPVPAGAIGENGAPRAGAAGGSTASISTAKVTQKSRVGAAPKAVTKGVTRRILIYVRVFGAPIPESGVGGGDNCASYAGCTDEEYCIVWGLRCDLVPAPVGTLESREGRPS
jgi:hypothetical protein